MRSLDLASGKLIWQTAVEEYIGAPLVFDNSLMIARRHGAVRRLDFSGPVREEWTAANSDSKDAAVAFRFGPVEGGGALWLLDEKGAIWRLGPSVREANNPVPPQPPASNTPTGSFNPPIGGSR